MRIQEIQALFDQQAESYDQQWSGMAPIREALHFVVEAAFSPLPPDARILCVGAGTGAEILHLAARHPLWRFTAVDPSAGMLEVLRRRAAEQGIAHRCTLHAGCLDSLPASGAFDAATSFLVSQFMLDAEERSGFFRGIAERLGPGGYLASADLASDREPCARGGLLAVWLRMLRVAGVPQERLEHLPAAYERDVAVLPPRRVEEILVAGGFKDPQLIHQAGMIHAWLAEKA